MEVQTTAAPDRGTAIGNKTSAALEASNILKTSIGKFLRCYGRIDSTAATAVYFLQLHNSATLPANGVVPLNKIAITHTTGTNTPIDWNVERFGIQCSTGIVLCGSTSEFTKTITGAILSLNYEWV
jgi:hypothetical protein